MISRQRSSRSNACCFEICCKKFPAAKREAVVHLERTYEMTGHPGGSQDDPVQSPATLRRRSTSSLKRTRCQRRRFGYRRLHVLLRGEGHVVNRKKTQRLLSRRRPHVRKRRARKRTIGARAPLLIETRPNARWSVDFVHDQLVSGRRLPHPERGG
jgi:putative transposase